MVASVPPCNEYLTVWPPQIEKVPFNAEIVTTPVLQPVTVFVAMKVTGNCTLRIVCGPNNPVGIVVNGAFPPTASTTKRLQLSPVLLPPCTFMFCACMETIKPSAKNAVKKSFFMIREFKRNKDERLLYTLFGYCVGSQRLLFNPKLI